MGVLFFVFVLVASVLSVGWMIFEWGYGAKSALTAAFATALFLLFSLRGFYIPTRYRLSAEGIAVKEPLFTRTRTWAECKSLHRDKHGVLVSPFSYTTRLENFRGVYLRFDNNGREVLEFLNEHMNRPNKTDATENDE